MGDLEEGVDIDDVPFGVSGSFGREEIGTGRTRSGSGDFTSSTREGPASSAPTPTSSGAGRDTIVGCCRIGGC